MTSATQLRRSGRSQQKPEGALRDHTSDSSDSEDAEDFVLPDPEAKKGKTTKAPAARRQPRKRKPPAPQQARDGDVDPQPVIAVAIDDLDILASHLDNTTEAESAVVILLNLVAQYAGRPTEDAWTVDDYPSQTVEELAAAAMASIEEGGFDHFKLTGRNGKPRKPADRMRARKKAEQFWLLLGQTAHDQGVDALELFEPVLDLSFMLSQSLVWCTRYAAVTTGLSIMTAIIELVLRAEERRSMLDRQLKAAARASSRGRASEGSPNATPSKATRSQSQGDPKTQSLRRERDREHDTISAATKRLCALFDCTVVTRCRDVQAAVRLDIVVAVGEWTVMYPSLFMKDAYLKYIAWGMSDKDPAVRQAAIEAVTNMVQDEEDALAMEIFLGHFRVRIVETGSDVQPAVCLAAHQLLHLLLSHGLVNLQQLLPVMRWLHVDTTNTAKQVADVVHGAADLLVAALQATADKILTESQQKRKGGRRGSSARVSTDTGEDEEQLALLTALRDFFRLLAGDVPQVAHLPLDHQTMKVLVQHLQPQLPVLRDWKVLAACLSADARDGLERVHLQDLAALLAASVEVEVASHDAADAAADADEDGAAASVEAGGARKRRSRQKDEEGGDVRQEVSLVLMDVMPGLLRNFANDPHVVKELVGILRHLDYAVYVAHNHHAAFEDLVNDVAGLFERSQDAEALAAAAAALAHCAQLPQLQLCEAAAQTAAALRNKAVDKLDECAEQLSTVTDAAMKKGVAALADGAPATSAADDAGVAYVYALRGAVARVGRLAMQQAWNGDLAADGRVRESLHDVLAARLAGRPVPAQVVMEAVHALYHLFVVDMQRVHRIVGGRGGVRAGMSQVGAEAEVVSVAAAARSFVDRLSDLLALPSAAANDTAGAADVAHLKHEACLMLIEVVSLCNARRADDIQALEPLALDVTDDTADALWGCADALLDAKAECCQDIDSLREGLESGGIADVEQEDAQKQLAAAEEQDMKLLQQCLRIGAGLMRLVLDGALGQHAVRIAGSLMAHCPLLDDKLNSIIVQFIEKLKKLMPHMLPHALVHALSAIFEELCQLDESRYGMEDFEEIARALAKPLCEFGTSQALLVAVWNAALAYVGAAATERLEFLSLGMAHFVRGLNADSAEAVLAQLEADAVDPATQGLADAVAASDVMEACMEALRGKAAKKPMPSALKKKGAAKAGGRKKARFVGEDSGDEATPAAAAAARPKAKVPATKANVNKLISGGGGWMKRRKAAEEEEEEDGDEDEIENSEDELPVIKRPAGTAQQPAPTPGRQTRTSQRAAAHTPAPPAAAPSIDLTGDDSDADHSGSDAEVVAPPTLAAPSTPARTPAAAATPRANRAARGTPRGTPGGSSGGGHSAQHERANSLMASDTPSRSQLNSLAASPSQSGRRQGNSLLVTESETGGSVPQASAGARGAGGRPGLDALMEADEADDAGAVVDVEMAVEDDEAAGVAGDGGVGGSAGWDSMPQEVRLPMNLFDTEEQEGAGGGGSSRPDEDEEMVDVEEAEGSDREGNEGHLDEDAEEEDGGDGNGGGAEAYDSEPEETTRIRRRRRR